MHRHELPLGHRLKGIGWVESSLQPLLHNGIGAMLTANSNIVPDAFILIAGYQVAVVLPFDIRLTPELYTHFFKSLNTQLPLQSHMIDHTSTPQ